MAFQKPINYVKFCYEQRQRYLRYKRRVESMPKKLICQECGGGGEYTEPVLDYGEGPTYTCGMCMGTGLLTPYMRGLWLKWKKQEKETLKKSHKEN